MKDIPTFQEKLNMCIEHDITNGIVCLIDLNFYDLEMDTKDDEELKAWLERSKPRLIEQIKTANEELQKIMPRYIGNAIIEPNEEDLIARLEAIEPKCVESWSEFLLDLPNKTIRQILYWMDTYIIRSDEIAYGGRFSCSTIDDNGEEVFHEEIYNFYKQILPIALVYLNEELLRRLGQLEDMTADENRNQRNNK